MPLTTDLKPDLPEVPKLSWNFHHKNHARTTPPRRQERERIELTGGDRCFNVVKTW